MAREPKMKVGLGIDNKELNDGLKQSKAAIKDFDKTSSQAFDAFGNAIGIDTRLLSQLSSSLQGLGVKLKSMENTGAQAFGKLLTSCKGLAAGIAGLGIGTAIAAFKSLNDEAKAFENTVQGASLKLQTAAYVDTYKQFLRDQNEGRAGWLANAKEDVARWTKTVLPTMFYGVGEALKGATTSEGQEDISAFQRARNLINEAKLTGEEAGELTARIYQLERERARQMKEISEIDAEIAERRAVMYDTEESAVTRAQALADVQGLIQKKLDLQLPREKALAALMKSRSNLASDSIEAENETIQQEIRVNQLVAATENEKKSLLRVQKQINAELAKGAEQQAEIARQAAAMSASRSALAGLDLSVSEGALATIANIGAEIEVPATLILDTDEAVEDIIDLSQEIESALNSTFASVGQAFGELVADLATGDNAWGNFAQAGLTVLGDLAQQVGKLAVGIGTAALGLEAALSNPLDPAAAIAAIVAGTALIALGAMVKKVGGNVNNYSASAGVASGSYSGSAPGSSYATQQLNVHVTGELVAKGSTLTAVLNNEKNRTNRTT